MTPEEKAERDRRIAEAILRDDGSQGGCFGLRPPQEDQLAGWVNEERVMELLKEHRPYDAALVHLHASQTVH